MHVVSTARGAHLNIRTLFPLCMFGLAAMGACIGGWLLSQAVIDLQVAKRLERAVDLDTLWFIAADRLAAERPVTGDRLLAEAPADARATDAIARARAATDNAVIAADQLIRKLSMSDADRQLDVIRTSRDDLRQWRDIASVMITLPKSERDPGIFTRYVDATNAILERLDAALDLGDVAAARTDGLTMDLIALSRQVWALRRVMGARSVPLMAALDGGEQPTSRLIEEQARADGVLAAQWAAIDATSRRLSSLPGIAEAVSAARVAFGAHDGLNQRVLDEVRRGANSTTKAMDFSTSLARNAPVLERTRDTALRAARRRVTRNRALTEVRVSVSASILVLILVAAMLTIRLLRVRIVAPVLALTEAIGRLARQDYDAEIAATGRMDEIGRMAGALETLRIGAIAAAATEARVFHMAHHDALTGLANRLQLEEAIETALARTRRGQDCALLCLDLDRFKAVNDTFGHPVGDLLLRAVADRLRACVRDVDVVSRLGGDEFVVLLNALTNTDDAAIAARRIITALQQPFDLDGQIVGVGVSVGIAVTPRDADTAVALLKNADTALYRAKVDEKGGYRFFEPEMHACLQARMLLERDLRDAVNNSAFEIFYQPQFTLIGERLRGFEALLRWRHPTRGMVPPAEFIPLAEETGLIMPIGEWVLEQACAEALHWPDRLTVSVNLSVAQFNKQVVSRTVRRALEVSRLPAARLDLEITESMLMTDGTAALAALHELHDLGIGISMDDFGTGYSSLSYLHRVPFDRIKIDQSFVRGLSSRRDARAIIRAVVSLGQSLGIRTLAEGVETPEQLAQLRDEGCEEVQGFLFGRPVPALEARRLANATGASRALATVG